MPCAGPGAVPSPLGRTVMIQGTASHVGKSVVAAGLCRVLAQDGWAVLPFKGQNMSNNAAVTADGGEIGRSQALQAEAAGVAPHTDMNPVLLKPAGNLSSEVVLHGRRAGLWRAGDPPGEAQAAALRARAWRAIGESLARLRAAADVVVIEGAGSPAELNLRDRDLANMAVAQLAAAPVLLVADIDRGGVFAALLGTLDLLRPAERARVAGLIVNRFHGDPTLFADGVRLLEERGRVPVLGVLPWMDLALPEEDGAALQAAASRAEGPLRIAVLRLPHISNFTDFAALGAVPGVQVLYAGTPDEAAGADALVVPGTRNARADLGWLRRAGWEPALGDAPLVLGICGGMQLLGEALDDPEGLEDPGRPGSEPGLGLLPVETTYRPGKRTAEVAATVCGAAPPWLPLGRTIAGYEIRAGESRTAGDWLDVPGLSASSPDGRVLGCYVHGLFDDVAVRQGLVGYLRARRGLPPLPAAAFADAAQARAQALDALAAALRRHLDIPRLYGLIGLPGPR